MVKLIIVSTLALFSTNAFALEEKPIIGIDMFWPIIFIIPLTLLIYSVFIHYKNNKRVGNKKSYASTNVIINKSNYANPKSEPNKRKNGSSFDAVPDVEILPSSNSKVASAIVIDDVISDGGDMSGGGSSLDFDFDFDWD
jgi:hypothetical protein